MPKVFPNIKNANEKLKRGLKCAILADVRRVTAAGK
jgi:hypothetical protein